jgi:hypothetical protein
LRGRGARDVCAGLGDVVRWREYAKLLEVD